MNKINLIGMIMSKKKTHEEYVSEVADINPYFEVIEIYDGAHTKIAHKCKKCGNIIMKEPISVLQGSGCPICKGRIAGQAPEYKNSIWASEYKDYFSNYMTEEQMKTTLPFSNVKISVKCPECGKIKKISPSNLMHGLCCSCGDGISYPNKFMYKLLEQLNIKYIPEYSPEWSVGKLYDIYIPFLNTIIENNGMQHYKDGCFGGKLDDVESNDKYKECLALENGIKHYCIIDCRYSDKEWIKDSVLKSSLPKLLDFKEDDINWSLCDKFASSNIMNEVVKLFNNGLNATQIGKELKINRKTVRTHLKKAASFGMCNYDPQKEQARKYNNRKITINSYGIFPIYCEEKNVVCFTLKQMSELCGGLDKRNIHACVINKCKSCGGMHFYYLYDHVLKDETVIKGAISL